MDSDKPEIGPFIAKMVGPYTAAAIEKLKQGQPGDTITRHQMAIVVGLPCGTDERGYSHVLTAIKRTRKDHRVIWKWFRDLQSWKCLEDKDKEPAMRSDLRSARKRGKKALEIGTTVDRSKLSDDERRDHTLTMTQAGMTYACNGSPLRNKLIAAHANGKQLQQPDPQKLVDLMDGGQRPENGTQ